MLCPKRLPASPPRALPRRRTVRSPSNSARARACSRRSAWPPTPLSTTHRTQQPALSSSAPRMCAPRALRFLAPLWSDLIMWSVLMGNFELTRILWRKSVVPLRTAVMARRLCLKLRDTCAVSYSAELASAADHFELWAMGCLDSISDSEDAVVRPPRPPPIPLHLHPSVPSLVPIGPAGPACAHLSAPAHTCSHLLPSLLTARACSCLPVYVLRISSLVYRCEGRTALAPTPSTAVPPKCGQVRRLPMSPHLPWPSLTFHGLRSPSMAFAHLPWPSLTFHGLRSPSIAFSHFP